ncbi:hypothetical protein PICMEDRAFT_12186 [Pichia membranifaciens NRRL Y-2026]|uniref:Uncharacterized protein n=1 Tax=Pichia membranifaciens NRRL Y-2026 TaxID=763406 RepID=A0A1E3NHV2_9ASCO|nr:hypothetical protein PICMEDRAFT_12186 [Pichia membranifaciens NRRL Y-2026]ODQ45725.1 hypothetical protein PICMEDRAFT_12186 [Pichia membranifaciens NRRL Y-2026]
MGAVGEPQHGRAGVPRAQHVDRRLLDQQQQRGQDACVRLLRRLQLLRRPLGVAVELVQPSVELGPAGVLVLRRHLVALQLDRPALPQHRGELRRLRAVRARPRRQPAGRPLSVEQHAQHERRHHDRRHRAQERLRGEPALP